MSELNIRLVSNRDFDKFQILFPETKLYDANDETPIDLLIFPGGEDVSPEYYMSPKELMRFKKFCDSNPERDKREEGIFQRALVYKRIQVNKILGVCRGCQFLAVMFGGSLFYDLRQYGIAHDMFHDLRFHTNSPLNFLKIVNSLHHQGVKAPGFLIRGTGIEVNSVTIATDKSIEVHEIITWMNGKVLGVQFHPEYYDESYPDKDTFRQFIYDWIADKKSPLGERNNY